jgi:polyphosphate glucokinase
MKILVIDVGGNNVKVSISARKGEPLKIPSGPDMTAARMAALVKKATAGWVYQAVSIGYPGPVVNGRPSKEPANLGPGWKGFDYRKAFGRRVRVVNDAAMQALGAYDGGRMLFLGLGTGLGSALVIEGVLAPMELAHLPYKKGKTYEDYVGERGLKRLGRKKWTEAVHDVVARLKHGLQCDYVVLGGGQTKRLKSLPRGVRLGNNDHAILGGLRLWDDRADRHHHGRGIPIVSHSQARPRRPASTRPPGPTAASVLGGDANGEAEVPSAS